MTTAGPNARLGILIVLVAAAFALTSAPASASYIHPEPGYEFGPTGTSSSSFPGSVGEMDFDQSSKRLFVLSKNETKIYSVHFEGPGTYSQLGAPFPLSVASSGCCTDIAIDNTAGGSAENLYYPRTPRSGPGSSDIRPRAPPCRPTPQRRGRSVASASTTRDMSGSATSTKKDRRVRTDRGRRDIDRRRRRNGISLPGQFRPLEQRHVRAAVFRPGCRPLHRRKRVRAGLGTGLRHNDQRQCRDQRNQACRLYSRIHEGLGL